MHGPRRNVDGGGLRSPQGMASLQDHGEGGREGRPTGAPRSQHGRGRWGGMIRKSDMVNLML